MKSLVYDPATTELTVRKNKKFVVFSNGANFSQLSIYGDTTLNSGYVVVGASVTVLNDSSIVISGDSIVEII